MNEARVELTLADYWQILRRRWLWILLPTVLMPIAAYLVSLKIPDRYTSTALVLVQQQQVPDAYVKPVVSTELQQRLATMQEQILSRRNLQPIIEKFGLFKNEKGLSMEELVDKMRKLIVVTQIREENPSAMHNGSPGFFINFSGDDARTTQQVCSEILTLFVQENLRARDRAAAGTTDFLKDQLEDAKKNLDEQDAKLAQFKQKYIGQLPGQEQSNLMMLNTLTNQLDAATQAVARAQQDRTYASALLEHEIANWDTMRAPNNPQSLQQQLAAFQQQLTGLQARGYTDQHPEIIRTKGEIARLNRQIESSTNARSADTSSGMPEPMPIQQLRLQVHQFDQGVKDKLAEQKRIQSELNKYQARIQLSPVVEEQYKIMTRDYDSALRNYNDLLGKKTQSQMARDLEQRQQGEQFQVMDAPNMPEKPVFPDRPMIAAGGFGGGLGLGLLLAFLLEMRDKSLRTERDITVYLTLPTLAHIPALELKQGGKNVRFWRRKRPAVA